MLKKAIIRCVNNEQRLSRACEYKSHRVAKYVPLLLVLVARRIVEYVAFRLGENLYQQA